MSPLMRFACKRLLILECLKLTTWLTSLLQRRYYGWLFLLSDFAVAEEIFCFARRLKAGLHRMAPTHRHYFQQTIFSILSINNSAAAELSQHVSTLLFPTDQSLFFFTCGSLDDAPCRLVNANP